MVGAGPDGETSSRPGPGPSPVISKLRVDWQVVLVARPEARWEQGGRDAVPGRSECSRAPYAGQARASAVSPGGQVLPGGCWAVSGRFKELRCPTGDQLSLLPFPRP